MSHSCSPCDGEQVRVTYRDAARLERLALLPVEPVKADVTDRAGLRRAFRGCDTVFHVAGRVNAKPADEVWRVNALSPRVAVEAAAAEGVGRVVVTSSVAGIGPVPPGEVGSEDDEFRGGGLGLTYMDAKHEGESEALAAGARVGVEVVVVNPSYVLGVPVDRSQPGETSTRTVGNYLRGRLPGGGRRHCEHRGRARRRQGPPRGGRKGCGGRALRPRAATTSAGSSCSGGWRTCPVSTIPCWCCPPSSGRDGAAGRGARPPDAHVVRGRSSPWPRTGATRRTRPGGSWATGPRPLDRTLRDTVEWYSDADRRRCARRRAPVAAVGGRRRPCALADRAGLLGGLRVAERYVGRQLVTRP